MFFSGFFSYFLAWLCRGFQINERVSFIFNKVLRYFISYFPISKSIKIENIIEEIKLQNDYANNEPQLAPKIYLVTIQYGNEFLKNIPIDDFLENGKETFNDFLDANKQTTSRVT